MWDVLNVDYFGMFKIRLPWVTLMFYVLRDCSSLYTHIYIYIYLFIYTYTDMHDICVCECVGCVGAFVYSMY